MKKFELNEEQIKMLKDSCLVVIALLSGKNNGDEDDKVELLKYKDLFDYINK